MKLKKIFCVLMAGVLLVSNTTIANAFSNSCSGQWSDDEGVSFSYNSDGTLIVVGENGTESATASTTYAFKGTDLDKNWSTDVTSIIVENLDTFGPISSSPITMFNNSNHNIQYASINATNVGAVFSRVSTLDTIVFGEDVRTINEKFIEYSDTSSNITMYIPSTVTYISEKAYLYSRTSSWSSAIFTLNVVCEYGTVGYNWATYMKNAFPNATVNIELYETQATSQIEIDNRALYEIVVPEKTVFKYTTEGWVADTYLGVTGTLPEGLDLSIKTDESFKVIGDEIIAVETVDTTTEDANSVTSNGIITTTLNKQILESQPHTIDLDENTSEGGYKIDYQCKTQSPYLMKQSYSGVIKFLIN